MIEIDISEAGVRFYVHVTPRARKPRIGGVHDGALKVLVTEPPDKGKANTAVRRALAKSLGVSRSSVEIASGQTSRRKRIQVHGPDLEPLASAVQRLGQEP
ncbi:DUF167 domain-containing protein [Roseimaritima sediminicola]|uniref:DUF167 domain-containing protein n=1 Tax=Roseimaritima sediminicola TaxID=2662066 RepID=UPI0012982DAF|nr:DUF167 domain-containing protein [Roseimaritima sediminicola]